MAYLKGVTFSKAPHFGARQPFVFGGYIFKWVFFYCHVRKLGENPPKLDMVKTPKVEHGVNLPHKPTEVCELVQATAEGEWNSRALWELLVT